MAFNDSQEARITKFGTVAITKDGVSCEGFEVYGVKMCREVAILAAAWAIGELQREMLETMLRPGGSGRLSVD